MPAKKEVRTPSMKTVIYKQAQPDATVANRKVQQSYDRMPKER